MAVYSAWFLCARGDLEIYLRVFQFWKAPGKWIEGDSVVNKKGEVEPSILWEWVTVPL